MEAKIITSFIPQLVNAISVCVLCVADKCLAEGLLSLHTYDQVTQNTGIVDDNKARILILAIRRTIEVHGDSFATFLVILDETLPNCTKDVLLPSMRRELEKKTCTNTGPQSLFVRYKQAVKEWASACVEREKLSNELKEESKMAEMWRRDMDSSLQQDPSTQYYSQHNIILESKIATCKNKVDVLVKKIETLKCTIEEQMSIIDHIKSTILSETGNLIDEVKELVPEQEKEITKKLKAWEDKLISPSLNDVSKPNFGRKQSSAGG